MTHQQVTQLAAELLADAVTEQYSIDTLPPHSFQHTLEVTLLPGVTDPAAENLIRAAHLLGVTALERAATGQRYLLTGDLTRADLETLAVKVFSNPVIQRYEIDTPISAPFVPHKPGDGLVETILVCDADDARLKAISAERRLSLDLNEMRAVQAYFRSENREPTDVELEMIAQTWSEHCVHKTFKALIDFTDADGKTTQIDGLLKTYIRAATEQVNRDWVRSAFVDNAGIVKFDDRFDLAFKVETHNHPSALEPFGGSNTGVGGVVRDILGVSARPIANTDVLCFGPPEMPFDSVPEGVLHPRRIADGVIHGVEDYGNKMGIPTVNGAIAYHPGYTANPLVFCGCLGLLPHGAHPTDPQPGDLIIVVGGRTGRDGLRGATFSSMEMDQSTSEIAGSSVQIGHPIHEKQTLEVVLKARDERLYHAITDCGAGGLSSAVGELGAKTGIHVQLTDVPLKYPGLRPWEIWLSEAQERMVFAVPPQNWPRLKAIADEQDIEAVCIGTFAADGRLSLYYGEKLVAAMSMDFLHDGIPRRHLQAVWQPTTSPPDPLSQGRGGEITLTDSLLKLLAHPDIRSKEDVIRRYDHEVQGGTAVKPLGGVDEHGPNDASVIVPLGTVTEAAKTIKGAALSAGLCTPYGDLDPYAMAWAAVDEAFRNAVAVGADPDQIALLDNFCWGNPLLPDRLGSLVRASQGCYDAAIAYNAPFVSGKDSLNNEYMGADGQRHAIPGTLLISALGIVPDVTKAVTMDLKAAGNLLYVIGETRDELGGSHYHLIHGVTGGVVPQPVPDALQIMRALHAAMQAGLVKACHDVSEGGIAVALAEMCIAGQLGAEVFLHKLDGHIDAETYPERVLYSQSSGRFIVEVALEDQAAFDAALNIAPIALIGRVTPDNRLDLRYSIYEDDASLLLTARIDEFEHAWRGAVAAEPVELTRPEISAAVKTARTVNPRTAKPRALILHATGTNRDRDAALACEVAGAESRIVHMTHLLNGDTRVLDYDLLIVPGGFSYGDDLGAGKLWATDLRHRLTDQLTQFVASGRPVLGICNGFQVLVKAGLLPGREHDGSVTLTYNESGHFECRWVYLQPNIASPSLFTDGLTEPIYCPVAHGEGRIAARDQTALDTLWTSGLAALTYVDSRGGAVGYPLNPNGSSYAIAALTNPAGNVFGLMPHPEDHIFAWQHPRWTRGESGMLGLRLFQNAVKFA
ncbi:MAG: phosphoribosylformylglycinamidine synthase subunit PurL [Chloroflexi bacterium]|uniref:phosphoribosylformylglycinamidine synthase subunit PurL n=1 Tax=Candidatus Flexifilum breve TaxID=3140694 RepID=UPI003134F020|nr:phosphoribosylformylglycinamidine synthase subunit PurL [Chloroflexota bacterium]